MPTDLYKGQAELYDSFITRSFSWNFIEKISLDTHLKGLRKSKIKVLDAGCGSGRIIEYLLSNGVLSHNIVGADSSKELLAIARRKLPNIKLIYTDISKARLNSKSFDLIVSSMVLQHLNQYAFKKTLKKFYNWLVPGGTLLYIVPHPSRMVHDRLYQYFERKEMLYDSPWNTKTHYFNRPLSDYVNETIKAGFMILVVDEPQVPKKAEKYDPVEYKKYTSFPSRLVIKGIRK